MKNWILLSLLLSSFITVPAQSITGTWKRIGCTLEYQDGKKEDLHKKLASATPCMSGTVYYFKADGTHFTQSPDGCKMVDEMSKATWKQSGNHLTLVSVKEITVNPGGTSYAISFSGNTVTLTHVYTEGENKDISVKVKKIVLVYQRI